MFILFIYEAAMLFFVMFLACGSEQDPTDQDTAINYDDIITTDVQDNTTGPSEVLYLTSYWEGTASINSEGQWEGSESWKFAYYQDSPDVYNCSLTWDLLGTPLTEEDGCIDAAYCFLIVATPNESDEGFINDGTCDTIWSEPLVFRYAFVDSYVTPDSETISQALLYDNLDGQGFRLWVANDMEAPVDDFVSTLVYTEAEEHFNYSWGYTNQTYTPE